jgi:hypothetical protein
MLRFHLRSQNTTTDSFLPGKLLGISVRCLCNIWRKPVMVRTPFYRKNSATLILITASKSVPYSPDSSKCRFIHGLGSPCSGDLLRYCWLPFALHSLSYPDKSPTFQWFEDESSNDCWIVNCNCICELTSEPDHSKQCRLGNSQVVTTIASYHGTTPCLSSFFADSLDDNKEFIAWSRHHRLRLKFPSWLFMELWIRSWLISSHWLRKAFSICLLLRTCWRLRIKDIAKAFVLSKWD